MTAVDPSIRLEVHERKGCNGIAVSVPTGSVYESRVIYCLKCMEDEMQSKEKLLEELRHRPDQERLTLLARHYSNELLHNLKLRTVIEGILKLCRSDDHSDASLMVMNIETLAEKALKDPGPPSIESTWPHKPGEFHTGHPNTEYLFLPMDPKDDYTPLNEPPLDRDGQPDRLDDAPKSP